MARGSGKPEYLTAAERVTAALREAITSGELPAGTSIRQEDVAAQHGVSRMPVREAFRQLEAEGLIIIYPGRGAFITRLDEDEIREIYEIRTILEAEALRRAFPALTATTLLQAEQLLDQLDIEQDNTRFRELDEAFHTTLYALAARPRLLSMIDTLRRQVTHFFFVVTTPDEHRARVQQEHREILAACRAGDVEAAVAAAANHLHHSFIATQRANAADATSAQNRS